MTFRTKTARLGLLSAGLAIFLVGAGVKWTIDRAADRMAAERVALQEYKEYLRRDVVRAFAITRSEWDGVTLTIGGWIDKRECVLASKDPYQSIDWYVELEDGQRIRLDYSFEAETNRHTSRPPGTTSYGWWELILGGDPPPGAQIISYAQHNCAGIVIGPREYARFTLQEVLAGEVIWKTEGWENDPA